jgi:hypothetical protein
MTNDVDIVLFLRPEVALRLEPAFPQTEFYCPPRDTLETSYLNRKSPIQRDNVPLAEHSSDFFRIESEHEFKKGRPTPPV